ncbi:MAG: phosphatidylinositol-specific phospholipase C/glycerophosphodiester phosphodiesterase family protein [Armatimonadetes bacterium]|nr:phosphatidylinositol-specific phospholipase C/glycerophosphodiester phosphodiesterase family protein [Armatimonadota bacterium]
MLLWFALALSEHLVVLPRAHSHNDYLREPPLELALENGFCSVEADVFLVDGQLLVAHDRALVKPERTLVNMYLAPLAKRIDQNDGRVFAGSDEILWVLIDIKADGEKVYAELKNELKKFPQLKKSGTRPAVRFVISGDRPIDAIQLDRGKIAGLDGRWDDLGKGYSVEFMPWVSESWSSHFSWVGTGAMPALERSRLRAMVRKVHSEGRRIRFWGAPDSEAVWKVQFSAGVDFLNTDKPSVLRKWLLDRQP